MEVILLPLFSVCGKYQVFRPGDFGREVHLPADVAEVLAPVAGEMIASGPLREVGVVTEVGLYCGVSKEIWEILAGGLLTPPSWRLDISPDGSATATATKK